jgi:hypothetical protein
VEYRIDREALMPAWAARRRNSLRTAALDHGLPRVGPSMTQNSGPTGSSMRAASQGPAAVRAVRRCGERGDACGDCSLRGRSVVVFPELSLTGYELDAPAITVEDPQLAPIVEACAEASRWR